MKVINKLLLALSLLMVISSCEEFTELDLLDSPNQVSPDQVGINDLYNSVQLGFNSVWLATRQSAAALARLETDVSGFTYDTQVSPNSYNFIWNQFYARFLPDVDALITTAGERNLNIHGGTGKIMKGFAMMLMVDMFGDIPYSEYGPEVDVLSPMPDPGEDVYAAALALIDSGIQDLDGTNAAAPTVDVFYNGDASKWIAAANTMKLRAALTTRLVDGSAASTIDGLVSAGNLIDDASEDFEWQYGVERNLPNSRHPLYNDAYENTDATYQANWFMWLLHNDKEDIIDPRIRFYFYRQDTDVSDNDPTEFSCLFLESETPTAESLIDLRPPHYAEVDPDMPFCVAVLDRGYYGRDHLNGQGIPPDGPTRTVWGLYPAGGKFDDNSAINVQNLGTNGALGTGINPMLLSSFTDFMLAEAALTLGTSGDPRSYLESGVRKSLEKVIGFAGKVDLSNVVGQDLDGNPITAEEAYLPDDKDVQDYIDAVLAQYDAAADDDARLNVIMKEYHIALYGNGIEAYNNYRRTGKPEKIQPSLQPINIAGPFMTSVWYPNNHVNLNSNASQKDGVQVRVFWDDGSADVY